MKNVFLISCFFLISMIGKAENPVTYSGNQLPTAVGWTELKFDNTLRSDVGTPVTATTQGNALKLTATSETTLGNYKQLGWYKTNLGFNSSVGYTIEIRAKVNSSNGAFNIQGYDASGRGFRLVFYPNKLVESTGSLVETVLNQDSNGDAFHTYRVAVAPDDKMYVYRDGTLLGAFPLKMWAGDNIMIDGSFESGRTMADIGWLQGNDGKGTLSISNDPAHVRTGSYGLLADGGKHTYADIPLKPGASYAMSFWGKTIKYDTDEWRDVNGYVNPASHRVMYGIMDKNNTDWKQYSGYKFEAVGAAQDFNVELWVNEKEGYGGNKSAYDDFLLTERIVPSIIPEGVVNLFPNGDFEDPNYDYFAAGDARNDTSLVYLAEDNMAPDWHPFWGARVRLQYSTQSGNDEAGPYYARSGKYSLRFFNCFGNDTQYGVDINKEHDDQRGYNSNLNSVPVALEANKTYTFSFWYHFAKWGGDHLILVIKNGKKELFRKTINNSEFPDWQNKMITFTTDDEDHELKILTERDGGTPGVIYLDDLVLFEGEPATNDNTYLFFGKPTSIDGVDVEIESVMYDNTGAYAPNGDVFAATYAKKTAPLMTTWGENLQATDPIFNQYPRPQLQRNNWVNLNGVWKFARKESKTGFGTYNANEDYRKEILVPYPIESALSGIMDEDYANMNKSYVYKRNFTVDAAHSGKQIILHFGAVDWESYVFVNGTQVAHHLGGYDPFSVDITEFLKTSGEQELVVHVYDPTKGGNPRGKQDPVPGGIWYTPSSGIWQTVWYEAVNPTYVSNLSLTPVDNKALKIRVDVENATGATAEVTILDGATQVAKQTVTIGQDALIPVNNAKLWSPDSPFLYDLSISITKGGSEVDKVSSYFGMRKIEKKMLRDKPYMYLNDEPIFNYGVLDQGFWPDGLHTAPSYEALRFDLEEIKKLGMNMVRKHIKVEPARWFYYCDSIGLMVWQDMPTPAGLLDERVVGDGSDDAVKENFLRETEILVNNLKNYPSIVMWVPYNEGWAQFAGNDDPAKGDPTHTINGVNLIRSLDDTRLINPASGWTSYEIGDILDKHNYSEPALHTNKYNERISVCGETGGYGFVVNGHIWSQANNPYTSITSAEEFAEALTKFNTKSYSLSSAGINGIVYTQITDVEEEVNGFLTYDRKVNKLEMDGGVAGKVLKEGIERMKTTVMMPILKTNAQGGELWKYVTGDADFASPGVGWNTNADFDDSTWATGLSGFGGNGISANTPWLNQSIFLRKIVTMPNFETDAEKESVKFTIFYDEDYELYINGVFAAEGFSYVTSYQDLEISDDAKEAIVWGGENLFAIHVIQTGGGQFIDLGVYSEDNTYALTYEPPVEEPVWTEISTVEEFLAIKNNLSGFYKLTADLDMYYVEYQPIGSSNAPFTGYFDGNGYRIRCPELNEKGADNLGLFGYASGAHFTDLELYDVLMKGKANVGSLLGYGVGVTVERVVVKEPMIIAYDHGGGLIGATASGAASRIKDCYVMNGDISSLENGQQLGGLIGVASDTRIENSYFTGTIAVDDVTHDNRDAAGIVARIEGGINMLRGVVSLARVIESGSANEFITYGSDGVRLNEFSNCYTRDDMAMSELTNATRQNQLARATEAQKRPLSDFQTADLYKSIGWDFTSVWKMSTSSSYPYPVFRNQTTKAPSVSSESNEKNLSAFANDGNVTIKVNNPAAVWVYDTAGKLVKRLDVQTSEQFSLPSGVYVIKSACNGNVEALKLFN